MGHIKSYLESLDTIGVPREDSALGLPLGMETKIVCKHNMRNLMDMSHQRMCNRAYHEYRGLFNDVCDALGNYSEEWKYIVDHYFMPKCKLMGFCSEKKDLRYDAAQTMNGALSVAVVILAAVLLFGNDGNRPRPA